MVLGFAASVPIVRTGLANRPLTSFSSGTARRRTQAPHRRAQSNTFSRRRVTASATMADYTLYYMPTPNGKKISLALEELGLAYTIKPINILKNDQFTEDFIRINPNSKIPALVDHTGAGGDFVIFESGAILEYLAEKSGKLMPGVVSPRERYEVKQWLYWQMAGLGPMLGQVNFFWRYSKVEVEEGKERYLKEGVRLFGVLDKQLEGRRFICGDSYSIADIACYWWTLSATRSEEVGEHFQGFSNVKRWQEEIGTREAVAKVNAIPWES